MICKKCGTQTAGALFCTHCGAILYDEQEGNTLHTGENPPADISTKQERIQPKKRGRAIRFGRLILPALLLFYPLIYFFVDLFIQLPDALFATGEGGKLLLAELFSMAADSEFSFLSLSELSRLALGGEVPLYRAFRAFDLLGAGLGFVPLWLVAVPSALSVVMGLLLLVTKGGTLRSRFFADLTLFAGYFSAFSPALGMLWIRASALGGGFAAADTAAVQTFLSVEATLLVGIAACFMLPALSALRHAMANSHGMILYVPRGYGMLGGRSFAATRALAIAAICAFFALTASLLFLPILTTGRLTALSAVKQSLLTGISSFAASIKAILGAKGAEVDFFEMTQSLLDAVYLLQIPLLLLSAIGALSLVLTVVFDAKKRIFGHKRKYACLSGGSWELSRIFLSPYFFYVFVQCVLVVLWFSCSSLVVRVDFSNVGEMLQILYLTVGYVRTLCGTNTLYALLCAAALLLAAFAGNLCRKLANLSK